MHPYRENATDRELEEVLVIHHHNGKTSKATDEDRRLLRPLHTSHFTTCADADNWRSKR